FREEIYQYKKQRNMGKVIIKQSFSTHIIAISLLTLLIAAFYLLSTSTYARKETVSGYLVPEKGTVRIHSNRTGVVDQILVSEGELVKSGDMLVKVRNSESLTNGIELSDELISQITSQIESIEHQVNAKNQLYISEIVGLEIQINKLEDSKKVIENTILTDQNKLILSRSNFQKSKKLHENGHISKSTLDEINQLYLDTQVALNVSQGEKLQVDMEINNLKSNLVRLPHTHEVEMALLERQVSELESQLLQLNNQFEFVAKAPEAGYITGIRVNNGSPVTQARPILSIIPIDSPLHLELLLPSRSIGFIEAGNTINVRFDAFPYQKFGLLKGTVSHIDKSILLPNDTNSPLNINQAMYRIQAKIDSQSITAYGKQFPLKAGMLAQADIVLEKRTLLEWFLEPIFSIKGKL
ncbi:hypothetical protein BIY21_11160, partial [Vibrio ponticus]